MDTEGLEAAEFYCSIVPNSKINFVSHYTEAGPREVGMVLTVDFELDGQPFTIINGGPEFTFDEAVSFLITGKDQDEVDYYWDKLTQGGEESQCGWLKDRYGVSWQVVPAEFEEMMTDPDKERVNRALQAMFGLKKLDLAALQAAADGR
jgi:predicted 3-demethylubiquinone-9 3-methyltransferase (glyoxalase superfamily)